MIRKLILLLLLNAPLWLLAQPTLSDTLADGVVAVVGDKIILKSDIEHEFLQMSGQPGAKVDFSARCQILDQMISNKIFVRQAEVDSIKITDDEIENQLDRRIRYFSQMVGGAEKLEEFYGKSIGELKEEFRQPIREQILAGKMQDKVYKDVTISPSEVKDFFRKTPEDSLPFYDTELEVGQIILYPETNDYQRQYAFDKLNDIKTRIGKGENFETLALLYSQDPGSAQKGGDLGFFGRGEMVPEFEAVAFKLKPMEVSNIIKTKFGYHVLQLLERRGERVHARHILIKPPSSKFELEKARKQLDSVRTLLVEGKIGFREAVKRISQDDETKNNGGLMQNPQNGSNSFLPDQLPPELYFKLEKMKVGEFTECELYQAPDGKQGYRIVLLHNKSIPHRCSLQDDYGKVQLAALNRKKSQTLKNWLAKARQRTYIRIDESYLSCDILKRWIKE